MNKAYILSLLVALMCCCVASAVPAWPGLHHVQQPDGSRVTLQIVGDECFNYVRTSDGFTVVRTDEGAYEYATLRDGVLVASGVVAHDRRSAPWQSSVCWPNCLAICSAVSSVIGGACCVQNVMRSARIV